MILVTGGTGFIGREVVKRLLDNGYNIKLLARDTEKAKKLFPSAKIVKGDALDKKSLGGIANDVDILVHLAGVVSYRVPRGDLFRMNFDGTKNILEACKDVERIIFSSSVSIYGPSAKNLLTKETDKLNPKTPYALSKYESEKFILSSGIPCVALRISPVYGAGGDMWIRAIKFFDKGFPIPRTENKIHLVHVSDVVQAVLLSLKKGKGAYNIAGYRPVPVVEFCEKITLNLDKKPKYIPYWIASLSAKVFGISREFYTFTMHRQYDISKARKELGFNPKADFDLELKRMIEWYKGLKV